MELPNLKCTAADCRAQTSFYGYFIAAHVPIPNGITSIKHERLRKEPFLDHRHSRIDVVTSSQKEPRRQNFFFLLCLERVASPTLIALFYGLPRKCTSCDENHNSEKRIRVFLRMSRIELN